MQIEYHKRYVVIGIVFERMMENFAVPKPQLFDKQEKGKGLCKIKCTDVDFVSPIFKVHFWV